MEHTYFGVCPGCGEKFPIYINGDHYERKFCSKDCWRAYAAGKKEAKVQERRKRYAAMSQTLVPQERCEKCKYSMKYLHLFHCGYLLMNGTSRTMLHPEGLTADCQEFTPKRRRKQDETK